MKKNARTGKISLNYNFGSVCYFRADILDLDARNGMTKILRLFHLQESAYHRFERRHPTLTFSIKNKVIAAFHRRKSRFMFASVASLFWASSSQRHVAS